MNTDSIEKIPPQSLEAEMSFLGSVLIDKDAMLKIADMVKPEDFYKDAHAKIFESVLELYAKSEPIDLLTLGTRLEERGVLEQIGGRTSLAAHTTSAPPASNVAHYAGIIHRKAPRRPLLPASHEITRLSYNEEME